MAFIFPDDKAAFTAPNGITYAWKTDHWVVQKFKGDHEVYVSPTPPDDPQEGKLWYDTSSDVIELFIYVDGTWVSCTPASEYALEARIAANEEGIRDLWTDQQRQDFEIAGIENRVDQLEGKVGEYLYTFNTSNPTPRDGQMALLKADMSTTTRWEDVAHIAFNPNSLSGEIFDVSEVVTGDVIRLFIQGDLGMQVSAFEAKVVQNNTGILSVSQTVKAVGTGMDGAAYEVEHLSSYDPAGLATMDYVDAQDDLKLNLAGGTLTGPIDFQRGSKDKKQFKISPNADTDYATNIYSLNGGDMRFRTSHTADEGNHVGSHIILESGGGVPQTKVYHVIEPTLPDMAANKAYVDSQAQGSGSALRPPGLRFGYQSGGNADVDTGRFIWYTDGGRRIKISTTSQDFEWGTNTTREDAVLKGEHLYSIWSIESDVWKLKVTGTFNRIDFHIDDILVYVTAETTLNQSFQQAPSYYITLSGLF